MTTILMVSGSWPPEVCGVGDYTERLCRELEVNGISVVRFADAGLSQIYSRGAVRRAMETDCDLVHIQYPTAGYGRSYTPAALPVSVRDKPVVVTLHEYSVFRWYRRAWFATYARHCAARIFTTDEERLLFQQRFPERGGIDDTIEIGSNIPMAPGGPRDPNRVLYFGLIAPNKGIEAFLALSEQARAARSHLTFEMIGAVQDRHRAYAEGILRRASACGVQLSIDIPDDAVAQRLATAAYAYLPFPDGASGKRGTLAAAIVNGLIVVTRHSAITPQWMATATLDAHGPAEALDLLTRMQADRTLREAAANRSGTAGSRYRWDLIAGRHADLYRSLLSSRTARTARGAAARFAYESRIAS
jgi:glycosyltransferase involved in cell wall biosynthesis